MSAIKARDLAATRTLRSALSSIDNAEATGVIHDPRVATGSEHIAGATTGLGAAEEYESLSRGDLASQLRAEADVLSHYLNPLKGPR